jgi:hypothetical protein
LVRNQLTTETWMSAEEAVTQGYATTLGEAARVAAQNTKALPERFVGKAFVRIQDRMDLKARLGLAPDATDEQVSQALDQLLAKKTVSDAPPAPAPETPPAIQPDIASLVTKAVSDAFAAREAAAAISAPQVSQAELHASAAAAAVERFIGEGKIPPHSRPQAIQACGSNSTSLAAVIAYWDAAPKIVNTATRMPALGSDKPVLSPVQKMVFTAGKSGMSEAEFMADYNKGQN